MPTTTALEKSPRERAEDVLFRSMYGRSLHRATKRTELDSRGRGYRGWTLFVQEVPQDRIRILYLTAPHPYRPNELVVTQGSHNTENTLDVYIERIIGAMRRTIQSERATRRLVSYCYTAGRYWNRQQRINNVDIEDNKKPPKKDLNRWCSIEVECIVPDDARNKLYRELNGDIDFRRHLTWKSDSSISPDESEEQGVEFVLCAPLSKFNGFVDKLCKTLESWEVYVNDSCGLHVHLDQRQNTPGIVETKVYPNLAKAQPLLQRLVKKERITSTYCYESPLQWDSSSRYRAINACAYDQHGTLEVRLHHGTLNPTRIKSWVSLLWAVADKGVKEETSVATALRALELDLEHVQELVKDVEPTPLTWPVARAPEPRPRQVRNVFLEIQPLDMELRQAGLSSGAAIRTQQEAMIDEQESEITLSDGSQVTRRAVLPRSESVSGGNAEGIGQVDGSNVSEPGPVTVPVRPRRNSQCRELQSGTEAVVQRIGDSSTPPDVSGTNTRTTPYPIGWRVALDPANVIQVSAEFFVISVPRFTRNLWKMHSRDCSDVYVMEAAGTQEDYERYVQQVYLLPQQVRAIRGGFVTDFSTEDGIRWRALEPLRAESHAYSVLAARLS